MAALRSAMKLRGGSGPEVGVLGEDVGGGGRWPVEGHAAKSLEFSANAEIEKLVLVLGEHGRIIWRRWRFFERVDDECRES